MRGRVANFSSNEAERERERKRVREKERESKREKERNRERERGEGTTLRFSLFLIPSSICRVTETIQDRTSRYKP